MPKYTIEDAPTKKYTVEDAPDPVPAPAPMGLRDTAIHTFDPLTQEQRDALTSRMGNTLGNLTASFADTALGAGQGIESFFYHPLSSVFSSAQQVIDVLNQTTPDSMLSPQGKAEKQAGEKRLKDQWESIKDNPDFALGNMLGTILLAHSFGEVAGPVTRGLKEKVANAREGIRTGTQSLLGAGNRAVAGEVSKVGEAAKTADEAHLSKTQDALHETAGRELQYQQAVKAAQDTADAANKALDEQHQAAVQDALQQTREKEDFYQSELRKAKAESEDAYQEKLRDVEKQRAKAEEDHRKELRQYFEQKAKIERTRAEAVESYKKDIEKQGKIEPAQQKLHEASSELRARVETARNDALKEGNNRYNTVNEKLNPVPADIETVQKALEDAKGKIKGSEVEPPIFKQIDSHLEPDYVIQGGAKFGPGTPVYESVKASEGGLPKGTKPLTYEDLQGFYSELGSELSKGNLAGDVYTAMDTLHEAIGDEMQRIADSKGMGEQLTQARNYWRRMKQTFGKPITLSDNATAAIKGANPQFLTDDSQANRVRMLGSFDPKIPEVVQRIGSIQKGIDNLPKPTSSRVLLGEATKKATAKPVPPVPSAPAPIPSPEPVPPREVAQPTRVEPPNRPTPVEAKLPKPPSRVEAPDRPEQTAVDTRVLREHLVDKWATGESSLNKWQVRALLGGGLSALIDLSEAIGGRSPGLGSIATEAIGTGAYTFGPAMVARLLEKPGFREWITRPPEGELNTLMKLPNADRITLTDGLRKTVQAAQKQGIKVDPKLAVLLGVTVTPKGPATLKLQQARDHARFGMVATGPKGERIGSNDGGETWVDTETGEPVHAQ